MPFDGTNRTVADILDGAATIIEERGHCQRAFQGPHGEVCMFNAIHIAATGEEWLGFTRLSEAVDRIVHALPFNVCLYNNAHTKDECVAKLREMAQQERANAV